MKKMNRVLIAVICTGLLFGCGNSDNKDSNTTENLQETENPKDEKLERLETVAFRLRAGGSIKSIELKNDSALIVYVKDYNEYKKINPQSGVTEELLEAYWESGHAIHKALIDGSVRIMKKLDYINQVTIKLPYKGKTYSIEVLKSELETFIGSDFKSIVNNWDAKFSDPYVYNDKGRVKFFNKFGKTE